MEPDLPSRVARLEERVAADEHERYLVGIIAAKLEARVDAHDGHLGELNRSLGATERELKIVADCCARTEAAIGRREAVDIALHDAVASASDKQVSTRTFVLGLLVFLVMLATLLLTVKPA